MNTPMDDFITRHQLNRDYINTAYRALTPLIELIMAKRKSSKKRPIFIGLNGCQGSGKSTLADFLVVVLTNNYQLATLTSSLDDYYLSSQQRVQLAEQVHPLLKTRGVPGTHDIKLLTETIERLQQQRLHWPLAKFNKATDDPLPRALWPHVDKVIDVVIIEGWCWGVMAQSEAQLVPACNQLEIAYDSDKRWRTFVNQQLKTYYQPLYQQMDLWLMLKAPSFSCVYQWRLEQEDKLRQNILSTQQTESLSSCNNGQQIPSLTAYKWMNADEIHQFIQHFERLTIHALNTFSTQADVIILLDQQRRMITQ